MAAFKSFVARIATLAAAGLGALGMSENADAASCDKFLLTNDAKAQWHNPHPAPTDFSLPAPMGLDLIFNPVDLKVEGLYGDERTTYKMGASTPQVFETDLAVRVGSSIAPQSNTARLLIGKYELSTAQYVVVVGGGDLLKGIAKLVEKTRDEKARTLFADFLNKDSGCQGVLTRQIHQYLAEPITFLSYTDYMSFLDDYNLYCISIHRCRERLLALGRNSEVPGFVRLPLEHEWEFVARGGGYYVDGKITRAEMQADLPPIPSGKTIANFAHVDSDPQSLLPIGSKEPLFGFYDMLGNARELMQNPFTAENGFGAVGAYVARGGYFGEGSHGLRVSKRVELIPFRVDDDTKTVVTQLFPYTGIRLAVGYPVAGASSRIGSDEAKKQFDEAYQRVGEAGDIAGNTWAEANNIGSLVNRTVEMADELSRDDPIDIYKFSLGALTKLDVVLTADKRFSLQIVDSVQKVVSETNSPGTGAPVTLAVAELLPGEYYVKIEGSQLAPEESKYRVAFTAANAPDTGIQHPNTQALAAADKLGSGDLRYQGFVGTGDRTDTYVVQDTTSLGGMRFSVSGYESALTVTFLDERQNTVRTVQSKPDNSPFELRVNSTRGTRGFIQITAPGSGSTRYAMTVKAAQPYDPIFQTQFKRFGSFRKATADGSFSGYLDGQLPALLLPVELRQARNMRIELTGLSADADLTILDSKGAAVESDHKRPGKEPEFFTRDLAEGIYFAKVELKDRAEATEFALRVQLKDFTGGGVGGPGISPQIARARAKNLGNVSSSGTTMTENSRDAVTYYQFTISYGEKYTVMDLTGFDAGADLDLFLEDSTGAVLEKSSNSGAESETIKRLLGAGKYYLRVQKTGTANYAYYSVAVSGIDEMTTPKYSWWGTEIEQHGDYKIYRNDNTCYMVAIAENIYPAIGWRQEKPYFVVGVDRGDESVYIWLDYSSSAGGVQNYKSGSVYGSVDGSRSLPLRWSDGSGGGSWLKPLSSCKQGWCVDDNAVRGFRRGQYIQMAGESTNGDRISFRYSLRGYTKAAQRINQICQGRANWVWNK